MMVIATKKKTNAEESLAIRNYAVELWEKRSCETRRDVKQMEKPSHSIGKIN